LGGSASWAGLINVFVQLVDANKSSGITGFVVRQGTAGLHQGPESLTMGMRGVVQNSISRQRASSCGQSARRSRSWYGSRPDAMLFTRLAIGAMSVGGMKRCTQLMLRYATRRDIATGCLLDNPVTLARLSDLTAAITTLETLVTRIAELLDNGCFVPVEAYVACKTSGPEFLWKAADSLVQLLGSRLYRDKYCSQILRDARVFRILKVPRL
jgi:alkylation response protein AidB-like acyl-CoA dehydrogenase